MMKQVVGSSFLVIALLTSSVGECRVGGGRSFGSRGSRGFSSPRGNQSLPYRNYNTQNQNNSYGNTGSSSNYNSSNLNSSHPPQPQAPSVSSRVSPFWKSLGAGVAGGMLGSLLMRSLGGANYGSNYAGPVAPGMGSGGIGIGILEILLLAGILFLLYRYLMNRKKPSLQSAYNLDEENRNDDSGYTYQSPSLNPEQALDLFFHIQGAWGNRDLQPIQDLLEKDARDFLDQEILQLKKAGQINRLENIAVRSADIVESWKEPDKAYATVKYTANLLDFTVDENTKQVVSGSKTTPVKFEEYWTFARGDNSSHWKLSAIQQNDQ